MANDMRTRIGKISSGKKYQIRPASGKGGIPPGRKVVAINDHEYYPEQLERMFREWSREHPNMMTPTLENISMHGAYGIELTSGRGMKNEPIYGVTIRRYDGQKWVRDENFESKMFYSKDEAGDYIKKVSRQL